MVGVVDDVFDERLRAAVHAGERVNVGGADTEHHLEVGLVGEILLAVDEDDLVFVHRGDELSEDVVVQRVDPGETADGRPQDGGERSGVEAHGQGR